MQGHSLMTGGSFRKWYGVATSLETTMTEGKNDYSRNTNFNSTWRRSRDTVAFVGAYNQAGILSQVCRNRYVWQERRSGTPISTQLGEDLGTQLLQKCESLQSYIVQSCNQDLRLKGGWDGEGVKGCCFG